MTCMIALTENPRLRNPVLIEGLPGIGLVANLATLYLIRKLNAKPFGKIYSSAFQDMIIIAEDGDFRSPVSELYYYKSESGGDDLILLYGSTQALTSKGQYELCWNILSIAESYGCKYVITLGGYRPGRKVREPRLYYAASDPVMAEKARGLGAEVLNGRIFGVAGLLIGLCRLRNMRGFCLLAETPGTYPDKAAAREVLKALTRILKIDGLDLNDEIEEPKWVYSSEYFKMERRRRPVEEIEWLI